MKTVKLIFAAVMLLAPLLCAGCITERPDTYPRLTVGADESSDATVQHLHDVAGRLLLFISMHDGFPKELAQVDGDLGTKGIAGFQPANIDPASGKPFVYAPLAQQSPDLPGRLIIYQSAATRSDGRWGLLVGDNGPRGRMIVYVQRVSEKTIAAQTSPN